MKKNRLSKQVNQYDKVLQENIEAALPGLIKNILNIDVVSAEELPDNIQHTKERKPDVLKRIVNRKGETFVLHIEFQTKDDNDMLYRMAEYLIMLARLYRIAVKQFVIYIGEGKTSMVETLTLGHCFFSYNLISISSIDYEIFLRSDKPEERMFAILANFNNQDPKEVITRITTKVLENVKGYLEKEQRKNQLRVLAQLRTLVSQNIEIMEHVSTFFKEENDIFYQVGQKKGVEIGIEQGEENKSIEFVKNLIVKMGLSDAQITDVAEVSLDLVKKIRQGLKQGDM